MSRYIFLSGNEIKEEMFEKIVEFDNEIFTSDDSNYVCDTFIAPEITLNLLKCNTATTVVCYDTVENKIVGLLITLAVNDEATNKYLADKIMLKDLTPNDIVDLKKADKTNLIVYSLGVKPTLRGKNVVNIDGYQTTINKAIFSTLAYNLSKIEKRGTKINCIVSEATSNAGSAISSLITRGRVHTTTKSNSTIFANTFNFNVFNFLPNYEKIIAQSKQTLNK